MFHIGVGDPMLADCLTWHQLKLKATTARRDISDFGVIDLFDGIFIGWHTRKQSRDLEVTKARNPLYLATNTTTIFIIYDNNTHD